MKRLLSTTFILALLVSLTSCNTPKPKLISQIIQMPKDSKIYTAYNLWYQNPLEMKSQNIHKGSILPCGTEVKDVTIDEDNFVEFRIVNPNDTRKHGSTETAKPAKGEKDTRGLYRIAFEPNLRMETIERFLTRLFVIKDFAEQTKGCSPDSIENIRKGKVVKGMTRQEVLMSYGYPSPHRTPSIKEDTWIYWVEIGITERVVFNKKKVIRLIPPL